MDFNLQNIEKVVQGFYAGTEDPEKCNQFLTAAQESPEGWRFCWELLEPEKPEMVRYYGAVVLHHKLARCWHDIAQTDYPHLYARILRAVNLSGPQLLMTKLCSTLSCFLIQETRSLESADDIQPSDFSKDLSSHLRVLLEVYTRMPEELATCTLVRNQRFKVNQKLRTWKAAVLQLVGQGLSADHVTAAAALRCFQAWTLPELEPAVDVENQVSLVQAVFQMVACGGELSSLALDGLTQFITQASMAKHPQTVYWFLCQLLTLEPLVLQQLGAGEHQLSQDLVVLMVAAGEQHTRILLDLSFNKPETKDNIYRFFTIILKFSAIPGQFPTEETCSEHSFSFWFALQEDIMNSPKQMYERLWLDYHQLFHSLVDVYVVKARYPPDSEFSQWQDDDKESFRCYRQDISDSLMYCYNVLQESMLANLTAHLELAIKEAASSWQYLEACLMAFEAVACTVENTNSAHMARFFSQLALVPLTNVRVACSLMETIGSYSYWLSEQPALLQNVVPYVLGCLRSGSLVVASASLALKDLTRDCREKMRPFSADILATGLELLKRPNLKNKERIRLMGAVGQVLSLHPAAEALHYLHLLLSPLFELLWKQQLTPQQIHCHLGCISALLEGLDTEHCPPSSNPVLMVFHDLLPILNHLAANMAPNNEEVAMAICDVMRRSVQNLLEDCEALLTPLLHLIAQLHILPQSVDISKQLLVLFGNSEKHRVELQSFYNQLCSHTLVLFQSDLHSHTQLVESFLYFQGQLVKKALPLVVGNLELLTSIYLCGMAALALPEKFTFKAGAYYLVEFIHRSREVEAMTSLVLAQGENLVAQLCKMIQGAQPRTQLDPFVDVLMALIKKYFDSLGRWLHTVLLAQPFPREREVFVRSVLRERANKRKLKEIVEEYALQCRGLAGTEYGRSTQSSL